MNRIISRKNRLLAFFMILLSLFGVTTPLYVFAEEQEPTLNVTSVAMLKDQSCTVKVYCLQSNQTVSFSIQDESIACITHTEKKSCTFTSLTVGKTRLVATIYKNGKKDKTLKCTINVTPPAVSVRFKKEELTIKVDQTKKLRSLVTVKPANTAETPTFTVNNSNRLRVTRNGIATGVSVGKAVVTATIANGKSDKITVYVKEKD